MTVIFYSSLFLNGDDYCLSLNTVCASKKKKTLTKAPCIFIFSKPHVADENSMVVCADLPDNFILVTLIELGCFAPMMVVLLY